MRELKFRVWDSEKRIMFSHDWLYSACVQYGALVNNPRKAIITMQYTGLKDKNGKEIYEGDIMKHPIEKRWFPWLIEFHGGSFCLVNIGIDGYKHEPMYLTEDRVSEREIIGNIYENPELLKR